MQAFRLFIAGLAAVAVVHCSGVVSAQTPMRQLKLTEKQVEGFIAAHKDMGAVAERTAGGEKPNLGVQKPDPGVQKRLEGIAKKFRFKDFTEYDDVAANIAHVMTGMDPQTKRFTDAPAAIKREIDEVAADKSIPEEERKRVLEELEAASSMAQPVQFPSTIEIITKYYDRLEKNSAEVALSIHARGRQPGPGNSASAWSTT